DGALIAAGASPVVRRGVFRRDFAALTFISGSGGLVEDVLVEDNEYGVNVWEGSSPRFVRATFRDNHAPNGSGAAGSIADASSPLFDDCLFEGNVASDEGGALHI